MNAAYPLFPLLVITILAYLTTWLFSKWAFFPLKTHHKFWNYLLLITFLVSGLIGLLSVVKINYKLEIPHYDQLLRWHVNFGIVMAVISIFHLSWHLRYFFLRSTDVKVKQHISQNAELVKNIGVEYFLSILFLTGFVSIVNQLVFIREFVSILDGNELVLGLVMAIWMILTGWGAYSGRKGNIPDFIRKGSIVLLVTALLPIFIIVLLYWFKSVLLPPGTVAGIGLSLAGIFLFLFPVCFLSGFVFTAFASKYCLATGENRIGEAYRFEAFGSLTGGVFFTILTVLSVSTYQVVVVSALAVLGFSFRMESSKKGRQQNMVFGFLLVITLFLIRPDIQVLKLFFPNQEIIFNRNTPQGNLTITRQSGQLNFYENNSLLFYTDNQILNEEAVHFAMSQHPNPKTVLLVSGGIGGMIAEIVKYEVEKIFYLETNPAVFGAWKELAHQNLVDPKVEFIRSDIRVFLTKNHTKFDVALINLPQPATLSLNRFYTVEFFGLLKRNLSTGGIVCTSLPSTVNYAEENALKINSSLWKTLGSYFDDRKIVMGEKNYFLASDNKLSSDVTGLLSARNTDNSYVNSDYFENELLEQRSNVLVSQFDSTVSENHDFMPVMFVSQISNWLKMMGTSYSFFIIIPALLFLFFLFRLKPVASGIYVAGFTASAVEVALLLAYQVFFGSLFLASALFFTVFMGGLALGGFSRLIFRKGHIEKALPLLLFLLVFISLAVPLWSGALGRIGGAGLLPQLLFLISLFIVAFLVGQVFYAGSKLQPGGYEQAVAVNYGSDLLGSAFGFFLTSLFLLPVYGLVVTCLIVAAINLFGGLRVYFGKRYETISK